MRMFRTTGGEDRAASSMLWVVLLPSGICRSISDFIGRNAGFAEDVSG